jgi:hypothetical protein
MNAPCLGIYEFSIENSNFDLLTFSIHRACPSGSVTNTVLCLEFDPTSILALTIPLDGGQSYWIRIAGSNLEPGYFRLATRVYPYSGGDTCEQATNMVTGQARSYSNCAATIGTEPLGCAFTGGIGTDVWFTWVADCAGVATVSICNSTADTRLVVYRGPRCPRAGVAPDVIACSDNGCGDDGQVSFSSVLGTRYYFRVGASQSNEGQIRVECEPACRWLADGCRADYNNDDGIDGDDVIGFFIDWDRGDECSDVDRSLGVDGDDVIQFFFDWDRGGVGSPGC